MNSGRTGILGGGGRSGGGLFTYQSKIFLKTDLKAYDPL